MPASSVLARLPYPSSAARKTVGIATIVTQAGIGVTGSVVRVTGSGLGCPTWPQCHDGTMLPDAHPEYAMFNQWIEFGNRLLTIIVVLVAALALLTALRMRRVHPNLTRPVALAWIIVGGVAAQGAIGGLTVLAELVWWMVALHFLVSGVLVWVSVLLLHAFNEGGDRARWGLSEPAQRLLIAMVVAVGGVLVSGTVLTGAGPHAGDPETDRLNAPIGPIATVHAGLLVAFLLLLAALGVLIARSGAPTRFVNRYVLVWVLALAQGTLGTVQYQLGVPEALVSLHVLGAFAVLIATGALWCAGRERGRVPQLSTRDRIAEANRVGTS